MDLGGWLRELGLGQYEAAFRDNEVDAAILPKLTADDLKEIGVVAVGHRRRLLDAIAALGLSGEGAPPPSNAAAPRPPPPVASAAPAPASAASAERRPITVMFCDLVGSTSLAARLDPEDWRNLVGSYLDAASAAVTSLGGHVLKKLGDGLMALFGYPQAQENDGERAVRAALAIQRALVDLNSRNAATGSPALAARIGLESGPVVVDHTGEVYGEAPNVAARVQSAAAPGEIWITRAVHRQIAGLFVAEDKGEHELKGVPEKTQLFRIVRVSGGGRRGGSRAPTPLVGRGEELDILARRWERARRGDGQLALITGEPGLGKSRLIEEFRARLAETPHTWIEWASSQLLQNTPLHPAAEWGRARFGGAEVAGEKRFAELEAALGSVGLDAGEYAPLLAPVIDAPTPPGRAPKLSPEELRSRQLAALSAWVLAGARTQPLVLAFEDLHWADPTSLDVLQALAERGAQASLLIIATTRPEFRPSWKLRSHHGVISLAPLDVGEVARMIGEISTLHALSKDVIAGVSERSGGVPLFVEEVTRLLLERGEHGGVQAIPPTLQQSLAARLDRLGPAREIAQIGAVLGRGFSYALLKSVAAVDDRGQTGVSDPGHSFLDAALEKLADAELLFVEGVAPHANYRFKHALIQDAAYDSLLKSRRQTLHRRAAEVLLASPAPEAEALAHHFTLASQTELAIEWWGRAGDQALRRSAFAEAISHLGKAIELSDKAGGAAKPREAAAIASTSERLKLQTSYGQAVMWSKGYAAEETKAALARVGELATDVGNAETPLDAYHARFHYSLFRGELGSALETAESFLRAAEHAARPAEAAAAHRLLGMTRLIQGDFPRARAHFEQTLRIYDAERDREAKFRLGQDSKVGATAYLAVAAWLFGEVARARDLVDEAGARATEAAHAPTFANTYYQQALFEILRDDAEAAGRAAEAMVALSREHGLALHLALGALPLAWARAKLGDRDAGSDELRQALAEYTDRGNKVNVPFYRGLLAEIEAERGDATAALVGIDEALVLAGETGEHWFDAGLHRIRGEILVKQNPTDPAPAEAAFLAAIAVAQQQKARSFELRAALSLAKLYQSTDRPIDAHDVLGPALQGFSPTPGFPQIAEATALFEALAADETVKADAARRAQRLKLQANYGQAVMWSKGFATEETKVAFERVEELAAETGNAEPPLDAYYARSVQNLWRGELGSAREAAESFLRGAERAARPMETAVAHRILGLALLYQGDFEQARAHCEQTLRIYDSERDREAKFRFGVDSRVAATCFLAHAVWCLGDVGRARELIDEAVASAIESGHVSTLALTYTSKPLLELIRDDAAGVLRAAKAMIAFCREHSLALYLALGMLNSAWARAKLGDRSAGSAELRQALADYAGQGNKLGLPFYRGLLAEIDSERGDPEAAPAGIDEALALAGETGEHWFDAGLHRIRGEILLKQNPADPAAAEAAFLAAIAVAQQQKARSFELRAALSLAELYQSTGRPIDAHDVLGPALAGFSPTPEFPQIAEAKALFGALAADERVKADAARRAQRLKLQTDYGQAVMWSKGFAAEETKAATARAGELASELGDAAAQLDAYFARWIRSFFRGEIGSAREMAESFLREAERAERPMESGVAHRVLAVTCFHQGDFAQAQAHCEQALRICDAERDREAKFRFGQGSRVVATAYLAHVVWHFSHFSRARELMDEARAQAVESTHAPTLATTYIAWAMLEILRDDAEAARHSAEAMLALSREHGLALHRTIGALPSAWARAKLGDRDAGAAELRQALTDYASQGYKLHLPFYRGLLAEIETETRGADAALAGIDGALALAGETGEHWFDAGLHRIRGEILLKQNPADPAAAEAAFLAAIAVARQQKARSFELRAALSLATLYQSTGRPIDAHDVLAPALAGFSPTPEFPRIAEAKALFEVLAADEGVKADAVRRAQRLKLQTAYGQAVMWSKGFAAEETKAATARAGELASELGDAGAQLDAYYGRWVHRFFRGELGSARETAESFLREAERAARPTETAVAHRSLGLTRLFQGDLAEAAAHCEQTLRIYDPERDREAKFRFGLDSVVVATAYLALAAWCLGEVGRGRELAEEAEALAIQSAHAPSLAQTYAVVALFEILRDDAEGARRAAEAVMALGREHGLALHLAFGVLQSAWARTKLGDRDAGSVEFRQALAEYTNQGNKFQLPFYRGLIAEIEAERGDADAALAGIDGALALAGETGEHWFDAGLHRIRGEILLKQNLADPAAAEATFLAAIAVAQQQKARSFELRAALSLAKLYQSTGRPIDAHDVLAPALAGFSPTPEFPQIAEAEALFDALGETEDVKESTASRVRRVQLQVAYGNALIATQGWGARETAASYERARQLATNVGEISERLSVNYGLWVGSHLRGELGAMRELSEAFHRDCAGLPNSGELSVAHRIVGATKWYAAEFVEAREHLEKALAIFDPARDGGLAFRFGQDIGVSAMGYSAFALWPLGEVELACRRAQDMAARAAQSGHVLTTGYGLALSALFEMQRRNPFGAEPFARSLSKLAKEHELRTSVTFSIFVNGWVEARTGDSDAGLQGMRTGVVRLREQGSALWGPLVGTMLAEVEAEAGQIDAALATIDHVISESTRTAQRWFEAETHRTRGEILVKQNPADPAAAEATFLAAIAVAQQQKARSFELRAALSLAKLYESTGRPIDAHDILGPALAGFSPTPEFPTIAEAKALFEALAADETMKAAVARRAQRLKLQTSYGQAVMWSKGYAAEEAKAAYARAGELAMEIGNAEAPFDAYYGWLGHALFRGELGTARETAESFLREAERVGRATEVGVGHRILGSTCLLQGDFAQARAHLEEALRIYVPERDREAKFRFGLDSRVAATTYLAYLAWFFGDARRARELTDEAAARAAESAHAPTLANAYFFEAALAILRDDARAARRAAEAGAALSREHGLALYLTLGAILSALTDAKFVDRDRGATELRKLLADYARQGYKIQLPFLQGLLAEIEAARGGAEAALAGIDEALALAGETGEHWSDAALHRIRGEILLEHNPAAAEAAFLAAIAVAQQQKARSFELRAALSLAKLYESTGRPIDAHDILGPALASFSPTPEFPQIAEASALFEALAGDERVKAEAARRAQRLKLQTSYGQAMGYLKGFAAEETKAVLAQTLGLAAQSDNVAERMKAHYARWIALYTGGELETAHEAAEGFLREAKLAGDAPAVAYAGRVLGQTCLFQGRFAEAGEHLREALRVYSPGWDASVRRQLGSDSGIGAKVFLAMVAWHVGDATGAAAQFEAALTEALASEHVPTIANNFLFKVLHEMLRGDVEATLRAANVVLDIAEKSGLRLYESAAHMFLSWAQARLGAADGLARFRGHGETAVNRDVPLFAPLFHGRLAELEAEQTSVEVALTSIDRAIELAGAGDIRHIDALLHRIRGDILAKADSANVAPAEEAYLAAISVAREQGARSFGLQAALALAKHYQSTGRAVEAHDVLAPALQGFSPTPEFPEVAEAKALFDAFAESEEVKSAAAARKRRADLHLAYGAALLQGRGMAALETKAAFERAREVAGHGAIAASSQTTLGLFAGAYGRGELGPMRDLANALHREVAASGDPSMAGVAHRVIGVTEHFAGDFIAARAHLEQAVEMFDPARDGDLALGFTADAGVLAMAYLAQVLWLLGEVDGARRLSHDLTRRIRELAQAGSHVSSIAYGHGHRGSLEMLCRDVERAVPHIEALVAIARDHDITQWHGFALLLDGWRKCRMGKLAAGVMQMRQGASKFAEQSLVVWDGLFNATLAEAEAESGDIGAALATIESAVAVSERTGQRTFDAEVHRIRGEILLKQSPTDPAAAEAAFLAAIAIAQRQKARSFELRAALSLAKLCRSTGRPTDAHDVLGPALAGFSPTPEFPEVAEATDLLAALEAPGARL